MASNNKNKKILYEFVFNIILPVTILNKMSGMFGENGPLVSLCFALSFPISYFFWDWIKTKHINIISILGFTNILLTGCFALFELNSHWYAVKEASIPLLIGFGIASTALTKNSLVARLFSNKSIVDVDLINQKLKENNTRTDWDRELKRLTLYLSMTFLVSAILNFIVTHNIVVDISPDFTEAKRLQIRNEQIADLTWKSYFIILVPSLIMLSIILMRANNAFKKLTGLSLEKVTVLK